MSSYDVGARLGRENAPSELVWTTRVTVVPRLITVTWAPGMPAFEASITWPTMPADAVSCAGRGATGSIKQRRRNEQTKLLNMQTSQDQPTRCGLTIRQMR